MTTSNARSRSMRCGPGLGCASLGRLCRVRCFFISGFPVSRLGVTCIRSRCCCRRIRSFRVLRIRRDHILNDRQAFADVRRNVAVASHPRCLLQASVRSQFPMSPVGLKCPRIRVNGLGRPNHRASRVPDGNRSDPDNHPMACLVPQGYLGSRRPFIAQHARPRAPISQIPFFASSFCGGKKSQQECPTTACRRYPVIFSAPSSQNRVLWSQLTI